MQDIQTPAVESKKCVNFIKNKQEKNSLYKLLGKEGEALGPIKIIISIFGLLVLWVIKY